MPALLQIVNEQQNMKVKTMAVNTLLNFVSGLIEEDKNEIDETKMEGEILEKYADDFFKSLANNLKIAVDQKHEAL